MAMSMQKADEAKKGSGWTNLLNHIKTQHPDYDKDDGKQQRIDNYVSLTKKANNVFGWLEWITVTLKPFAFIECPFTAKYSNLNPMSTKTLKKYMHMVTKKVEEEIARSLPEKFCILLDGWTYNSTHYVGVFASYSSTDANGYQTALLTFSPLLSELSLTALEHKNLLDFTLSIYGKNITNVIAICGDNCETNKALASLCQKPLMGGASHRFNLACAELLEDHGEIIQKINALMGKMKSVKLSAKLRQFTHLRPIQANITRWSSTHQMINRYMQLKEFMVYFDEENILEFIPSPKENATLSEVQQKLATLDSVTMALQRESTDASCVRLLFNEIKRKFPDLDGSDKYLSPTARIIRSPNFESGIVKIQDGKEKEMTTDEQLACKNLRKHIVVEEDNPDTCDDFASMILNKKKHTPSTKYADTRFILPTSNILERFFSSAGIASSDFRQRLNPTNLEKQLYLKTNKRFWDIRTVNDVLSQAEKETN